jgi:hypothetical protein
VTEKGPTRTLTDSERDSLRERGYVVLPGVVCQSPVRGPPSARSAPPSAAACARKTFPVRATSFCPELQKADVILDLFRDTPASDAAASLLGSEGLERVTTGQIALSFPSEKDTRPPHPHLDGLYTPDNGVPAGSVLSFTMLAGLVLSDVATPDAGNLIAWPGSHRILEAYFRSADRSPAREECPDIDLGGRSPSSPARATWSSATTSSRTVRTEHVAHVRYRGSTSA